jgi:thiol-disulfide isomerase/thioredoxin
VTWPSGRAERFEGDFGAGSFLLLREGAGRAEQVSVARTNLPDPLTREQVFARTLRVAVGRPLPAMSVKSLDGRAVALASQLRKGRRTLVNVWATWCVPCRAEMPELQRLAPALKARGVDLVGLNVDAEGTAQLVRSYLRDVSVTYANVIGGVAAIERLYATDEQSVPLSILVDDKGTVLEVIPGWSAKTRKQFEALAGRE